jgi:hypothetical protein
MTPGFPVLATVREEVRGIVVCAPAHIVDRVVRDPGISKLESNECSEVAVGFRSTPLDDRTPARSALHLASDLLANFECSDANVGTDRNHEIG